MKPTFKRAEQFDSDTIMKFMQEYYEFDQLPFSEEKAKKALDRLLNDTTYGQAWLICMNGQSIGYFILTFGYSIEYQGRDAFIDEFYIQEAHRGHGIGKCTLNFIENECVNSGITAIHLEVERKNIRAQEIYRRFGFEDHQRYLMTKWVK